MKPFHQAVVRACMPVAIVLASASTSAQQIGLHTVDCIGLTCGGDGGACGTEFCYRVDPAPGQSISWIEIGVEDGDINHYASFCYPSGWNAPVILSGSRPHDLGPTDHLVVTGKAGSCPYVLRFQGTPKTGVFQVGFDYDNDRTPFDDDSFHDVGWKLSGGQQPSWGSAVGLGFGAVHSPVPLNVVMIVLDDVGYDKIERFDGNEFPPYARTPKLDELADDGVWFTRFYVNPVCSTTRACLQTGRYAFRHGIGALSGIRLSDDEVTIAELLKDGFPSQESYRCGAFGKWHMTPQERIGPDSYDHGAHAVNNGYDRFYGTLANATHHYSWCEIEHDDATSPVQQHVGCPLDPLDPDCPTAPIDPQCMGPSCDPLCTAFWSANVVRADAAQWIGEQTRPFFAYVAFGPPHYALDTPPIYTEDGRLLISLATQEEFDELPSITTFDLYRAILEAVDSEIRFLIDDIGVDRMKNTMIFVVSDNGTEPELIAGSRDGSHGKDSVYELGVRTPMIVSGPLVPPGPSNGWESSALLGAVDLWRTIAAITGADEARAFQNHGVTPFLDSASFLSVIQAPTQSGPNPWAFSQLFLRNGQPIDCLEIHDRAITDGVFRYIRKQRPLDRPPCDIPHVYFRTYEQELYYLPTDAEEEENLLDALGHVIPAAPPGSQAALDYLRSEMITLSSD